MTSNRFTHTTLALAVLTVSVAVSGCADALVESTPIATPSRPAPAGDASDTSTPIVLEIDGQTIAGRLDDSPTARSLAVQLPLTLSFADHGGQEKYAELPEALDLTGAPTRSDAEALQIGYYVPDQRLILYYADVATFSGIVPIGTYDSAVAVIDQPTPFAVTIREAG